jgi:Transposase, Mutator family
MTTAESALSDIAARLAGTDPSLSTSLRDILMAALRELIEAERTATIGAAPGERTSDRTAQRNGHRPKLGSGHAQRCLCHTNRTGRRKRGRSAKLTGGRSFTAAAPPQLEQWGRGPRAVDHHHHRPTT